MNFNNLFISSVRTRSQLYNYQTVRWRRPRKPFWLGLAKSKMFIIPEPKSIPTPEEAAEMDTLTRHYKTSYKSLMAFIKQENPIVEDVIGLDGRKEKVGSGLAQSISQSLKMNEDWNNESARRRDTRMKTLKVEEIERAIKEIDVNEEIRLRKLDIIEEIVRKEKTLRANYITPENLDEAIENCLNKVDCFDFAIDLEGNKYHGRESLPSTGKREIPVENVT